MPINRRKLLAYISTLGCAAPLAKQTFGQPLGSDGTNADTAIAPTYHLQVAAAAAAIKTTNTLKLLLPEGSEFNLWPVIQLFKQLTGIDARIETVPVDDINTRLILDKQLNRMDYDIALPATFGVPDLVEAGAIIDTTDFKTRYEPTELESGSFYTLGDYYGSRFYGYQTDGDAYLMFYNRKLVTEARREEFSELFGYDYRPPATWQELDQHLAFFHRPRQNEFGGALFRTTTYLIWEFWARLHAKGQLPLADDLTPTINSEKGIEALEEMIRASQYLYPGASSSGLVDNWREFGKGNIYANIGWGGTQKYLHANKTEVTGRLRYSPLPGGKVDERHFSANYFNWGWNYAVTTASQHAETAYLLTLFAACPTPSTLAVREDRGFFDPFREEHYQDFQIQQVYTTEFLQAHREAMQNCVPDFYLNGQSLYFGQLRKYLNLAISGEMTAALALNTAAASWENTHKTIGYEQQLEQWRHLKHSYPIHFKVNPPS